MFSATKSIWIEDGRKVIFVAVAVNRFFVIFASIFASLVGLQSDSRFLTTERQKTSFKLVLQLSQLWSVPVSTLLFGNTSWKPTLYKFPTNCISVSNLLYISFKACSISISTLLYTSCKACTIPVSKPALYQLHNLLYPSWKPALYHCQACSMLASNLLCTSSRTAQCQFRTLPKHHCKMMLGIFLLKSLHWSSLTAYLN